MGKVSRDSQPHTGEMIMTKIGRPTLFSQELIDKICDLLSEGEPLASICRDDHMPAACTVRSWAAEKPDVSHAITRAREFGFDAIADECLTIVDNLNEDPQSRRVRADTRLRLLAKWNPKKYGDRMDHASSDGSMAAPPMIMLWPNHKPALPAPIDADYDDAAE